MHQANGYTARVLGDLYLREFGPGGLRALGKVPGGVYLPRGPRPFRVKQGKLHEYHPKIRSGLCL